VIGFVMKREGMSFPEAARHLAARRGIAVPERPGGPGRLERGVRERLADANAAAAAFFAACLGGPAGRAALAYLDRRGITAETRAAFGLGWAPASRDALFGALRKQGFTPEEIVQAGLAAAREGGGVIDRFRGRVVFPIHDAQARPVGFGGRLLGPGEPKYLNSPETPIYHKSSVLYGLHRAKEALRREGTGVVVEGYFDLITAAQAGVANVVATSGTALTDGHAQLMRRFTERWIVVFDGDAAGVRAAKRSLEVFVAHGLFARGVLLPGGADPDSFIRERGADAFRELLAGAEDLVDFFLRRVAESHRLDAIEGRVAAVREAVPLLAKMSDRVAQADYVARTAQRLGVREEVLWSEVRGAGPRGVAGAALAAAPPAPARRERVEEVGLVRALLASPAVAAELRGELALEELESEDCRAVAGAVFALVDRGAEGAAAAAGLHFEEERLNRLVAEWLAGAAAVPDEGEARRAAGECLARVRARRLAGEGRALDEKIRAAEAAGDSGMVNTLLARKQGLRARGA
jgi:DNA primase